MKIVSHTGCILSGSFLLGLALSLAGCSSSSPRFRSADTRTDHVVQDEDEFRFASKIKEETAKEDDKKVDIKSLERKLSGKSGYNNGTPNGLNRDAVLLDVVSFLGVPYKYGGNSKGGMDCSGLTCNVYESAVQKKLPRSTREQYQTGTPVEKDELQFGDLVFFNTTGRKPSHVGIYIEDDLFAHASVVSGVTISSLESTYYKNRYVGARRVVN
ncbi:MAG: spr product [Bacteroidetes bacterium]|nr:spr product [Bacteroidota bacterium]